MTAGNKKQSGADIMGRLGFDFLAHLEAMRGKGVRSIDISESKQTTAAAFTTWKDTNYPYRLPEDLQAFLFASDGFSLLWKIKPHGPGGGPGDSAENREITAGRIRVDPLSAITRIPLDVDDLRSIETSSRGPAAAAAAAATSGSRWQADRKNNGGTSVAAAYGAPALADALDFSGCGVMEEDACDAYGVAAFSLDSACEVGRVALVYGAPRRGLPPRPGNTAGRGRASPSPVVAAALTNPEVWIQDLSCRWHFLTYNFTSYFRMMVVHLGVLGWQQAFTPVGLSPTTEHCMRLYCPDRLLFDQLEWRKEKTKKASSAKKAAAAAAASAKRSGQHPPAENQATAMASPRRTVGMSPRTTVVGGGNHSGRRLCRDAAK